MPAGARAVLPGKRTLLTGNAALSAPIQDLNRMRNTTLGFVVFALVIDQLATVCSQNARECYWRAISTDKDFNGRSLPYDLPLRKPPLLPMNGADGISDIEHVRDRASARVDGNAAR